MPLSSLEVTAEFALTEKGIEPLLRPLLAEGAQFVLDGVPLTMPGGWTLRIEALITDFEKAVVTVDLPID